MPTTSLPSTKTVPVQTGPVRKQARPRQATIAVVLTAINTYRAFVLPLFVGAARGIFPAEWMIPAGGDVLLGITAPFVAGALWRATGYGVWVGAIVWESLAFADYLHGAALASISPISIFPLPLGGTLFLLALSMTNLLSLVLLVHAKTRDYYLGSLMRARPD